MKSAREYKKNTKKLWELMNRINGKTKHSGSIISYITVSGVEVYNKEQIANTFGEFYSKLGANLAKNIQQGSHAIDRYISQVPRATNSLVVSGMNFKEIEKIIDSLPPKTSSGFDGISNSLLKLLSKSISYPLSIIFYQLLFTGVFPEKMKIVEVIPFYKGKETDEVINYRPVYIMTISQVLEKIIYQWVYGFLIKK